MDDQTYKSQQPFDPQSQQYMLQEQQNIGGNINPQQQQPKKNLNVLAMIGLGMVLLSICLFMVTPQISIYAWIFGMAFSIAGLFFKPRWMAVIGTIISSIPLLFLLLIVFIINNPRPPTEEDLQKTRELREEVVGEDSLMLNTVEVEEMIFSDSIP